MSKQSIALAYSRPPDTLGESEYEALVQALSETARGRAFLDEHARRTRSAETKILLTAIERVEAQVRPRPRDPLYDDLGNVLEELRAARARIEAGGKVPKAEQLAALLELLLRRISKMLPPPEADVRALPREARTDLPSGTAARQDPGRVHRISETSNASRRIAPPPKPAAAPAPAAERPAARWLEEPLVPPPAVNDAHPPPRASGSGIAAKIASTLRTSPRVARQARPAPGLEAEIKTLVDTEVESHAKKAPLPPTAAEAPENAPTLSAKEALAAIMALSEEERIALFS
jgi:hypothetical protein